MKKNITIVGGAGYVGQVLVEWARNAGWSVTVIDPCYITKPDFPDDVHLIEECIEDFTGLLPGPVIYLATFHDHPGVNKLDLPDRLAWFKAAREIMVEQPARIAETHQMIYVSSMRSLTHPKTFYGHLKAMAEERLFRKASILRLGTVFGDGVNYTRTITVPNNYRLRGELPSKEWKAYTTFIGTLQFAVEELLSSFGEVWDHVEERKPWDREDLKLMVPRAYETPPNLPKEEHPMHKMQRAYNLPPLTEAQ